MPELPGYTGLRMQPAARSRSVSAIPVHSGKRWFLPLVGAVFHAEGSSVLTPAATRCEAEHARDSPGYALSRRPQDTEIQEVGTVAV